MSEPVHIISLGAGVQSSTMALMAACGEITPMPIAAVFADTQAEPKSVYVWLDWLEKQLPFPVHRVTAGSLREEQLKVRVSKKTGQSYTDGGIPAFMLKPDGGVGLFGRRCTSDFKIIPLQKKVKELLGVKRYTKSNTEKALVWIGISVDEAHRMKPSRVPFIENIWPLIDHNMSRAACLTWMRDRGHPQPPRSACTFCPFHNNEEWRRFKADEPAEFAEVVKFERDLQGVIGTITRIDGVPYLHDSTQPIGTVDFGALLESEANATPAQLSLFGNECEGMCGV